MDKPLDDMFTKEAGPADDRANSGSSPFKPRYAGASPAQFAAHGVLSAVTGPTVASKQFRVQKRNIMCRKDQLRPIFFKLRILKKLD